DIAALTERLRAFSSTMQRYVGAGDTTARDLMELAIAHTIPRPHISLRERAIVPPSSPFVGGERELAVFQDILRQISVDPARAVVVLSALPKDLLDRPDPATYLGSLLPAAKAALADFETASAAGLAFGDAPEIGLQSLLAQT